MMAAGIVFAVVAVATCRAFIFGADRRDVVFVAPVGDFAEAAFWPFHWHEVMVF